MPKYNFYYRGEGVIEADNYLDALKAAAEQCGKGINSETKITSVEVYEQMLAQVAPQHNTVADLTVTM